MNFGIIGCGGIADRRTIPGMLKSKKVSLVAVEDIDEKVAKEAARKYGIAKIYASEDDLLKNDEIEAVQLLEETNNKLVNFCQRILNKRGYTDYKKTISKLFDFIILLTLSGWC